MVDYGGRQVHAAVLLAGNVTVRGPRAALLYRRGLARTVVVTTPKSVLSRLDPSVPGAAPVTVAVLRRLGVPDSAILVLRDTVNSTDDEARAVAARLPALGSRMGVVTSAIYTRRARCTFRHEIGHRAEVVAVPAPDPSYDVAQWWATETGWVAVFEEWAKVIFHLARPDRCYGQGSARAAPSAQFESATRQAAATIEVQSERTDHGCRRIGQLSGRRLLGGGWPSRRRSRQ